MLKHWFKYACFLFIGAGVFARFLFLQVPYEYDELFTAVTANPALPVSWIWHNWLMPDVHPPLHNLLLWLYNHLAPYGPEVWLRLPSVLCGLSALALGWKMFPRRFGKTARLTFITLLSCNFYAVFYSQHARAYALMLLLAVPLTFLFLNISLLLRKNRTVSCKVWIIWGVLSLLLCWSHYFGALFFGIASLLLFFQALRRRRNLVWALGVPCVVFLLFLPWLVPNFLYNFSQSRFAGNWWANVTPRVFIIPGLAYFFFGSPYSVIALGVLLLAGWCWNYEDFKRHFYFPYKRDLLLLLAVFAGMFGAVGILSFKMYLWFGRYFMEIMPALYLFIALSTARLLRKSLLAQLVFIAYGAIVCVLVGYNWWMVFYSHYFSARVAAQFYRDYAPEKELFVIAMEAFPPASMEAMYAFYPNQVYGMNAKVTELYQLDAAARDKALERRKNALIWMPNCNIVKLSRLSREWDRAIGIEGKLGSSCFLQLSEKGSSDDAAWHKESL